MRRRLVRGLTRGEMRMAPQQRISDPAALR